MIQLLLIWHLLPGYHQCLPSVQVWMERQRSGSLSELQQPLWLSHQLCMQTCSCTWYCMTICLARDVTGILTGSVNLGLWLVLEESEFLKNRCIHCFKTETTKKNQSEICHYWQSKSILQRRRHRSFALDYFNAKLASQSFPLVAQLLNFFFNFDVVALSPHKFDYKFLAYKASITFYFICTRSAKKCWRQLPFLCWYIFLYLTYCLLLWKRCSAT